ncbi:MAG: alanine--tRNA ligase [Candidatus Eisenbacteria bacterium]|uniref:Alanine--tRNA ligase n=1 Tax=Eiseniibacteriota bacterium TaxID=2212470 RepID=A0A9D6QJ77_UNCEI|nr:alanine--tRNA ligase [Candidatus Eisenbacteria bacterium]
MRTASELRKAFLDFFVARGHTAVPSAPLVPNDPSLLFTTAGMVQFKPYYTAADVPFTRAVSVQKCLRLTDLENVGRTPRHDTFFEMLGNFSFGPRERGAYFKEEAIALAWEFVTEVLGLPRERLHASVFEGEGKLPRDDEAAALWKKVGLPADHVVALGRADNFWGPAGGRGACGPCSEIYFDLGERRPAGLPADAFWGERPGDPGDRYMEFWNLVFPQFDAQADGTLAPLPRPGIDTGMGIERLALIVQGKDSIFDTDLFEPLVAHVRALSRHADRPAAARDARIIADHTRALTFAIAEGALPGNEGAGYVLRRLLRRAVTRGRSQRSLAIGRAFLAGCAERAIERFGGHYRELAQHRGEIVKVLDREEANFVETFEAGLARLDDLLAKGAKTIDGEDAFALHDTYGFPVELTEEIAAERGVTVDRAGFDKAMGAQRDRARAASRFERGDDGAAAAWTNVTEGRDSEFVGFQGLTAPGATLRRWRAHGAGELDLVLDRTPCYAESGGQVADRGWIEAIGITAELTHVFREGESIVHRVRLTNGDRESLLSAGARGGLKAVVDPAQRFPTMRHHTATHLLHAALRQTLGTHVRQAGSLVAPDRLRFDYTHFEAPSDEQLRAIERRIVEWVLRNREVSWEVMPIDQAKQLGAMALFGEKYGAEVRVVTVPGVEEAEIPTSRELCGGTHVRRTGDIGAFVLISDTAIASGVRRIEALCGHVALDHLHAQARTLAHAAALFQSRPDAVPDQIEKLKGELERLRKAQAEAERGGLQAELATAAASATAAAHGRWLVLEVRTQADAGAAREAADRLRTALGRGAALLAVRSGGKLTFLATVTDDLIAEKKLRADELVRAVAKVTGGSGGGKPHLALAGAGDAAKLGDALAEARRLFAAALG